MKNIIEGINILEQTPIKDYTTLSSVLTGLGLAIAIASTIFFIFKIRDEEKIDTESKMFKGFLCFFVSGIVIALFSLIRFPWFYVETGRYTYECVLEDGVSANYISNNFDIIDVENDVWTIRDK